jgi:hypothetical protein
MDGSDKVLEDREIDESRKLVFPEDLKHKLGSEGFVPGKGNCLSVQWSYEVNSSVLVLSQDVLDKPELESIVRTSIYQEESGGNVTYKIRPPKSIEKEITTDLSRVDTFYYYGYGDMLNGDGDTHSVYLLTERQLHRFMRRDEIPDDTEELKKAVLNTPGFLPSV